MKYYNLQKEGGYSLISLAIFMMALGLLLSGGTQLYKIWVPGENQVTTEEHIREIERALQIHMAETGRYPCPAPLTAPLDTPEFGREVSADCTGGDAPGTFRVEGRGGNMVRTGAVPVRTLNLPDSYSADAWDHRFVYAVTEIYAAPDAPFDQESGAITVKDGAGNNASSVPGNIIYVLTSQGGDPRGAFSAQGALIAPCDEDSKAGANCAYKGEFVNTIEAAHTEDDNRFTHKVTYKTINLPSPCNEEVDMGTSPKDIAYLSDTSGSMGKDGGCPASLGDECSRIDVARWALRRVIPARLAQTEQQAEEDRDKTHLTGFVDSDAEDESDVENHMQDIEVDDNDSVESTIEDLCPSGGTPLGVHIGALADRLGDGTPKRPNVVMAISDGLSNSGTDPVDVAHRIAVDYPNLQVHIIDVKGNPSLEEVAEITGGKYYFSKDGEKLLNDLFQLSGICRDIEPPEPPDDKPGCGSSGDWWN